MSSKAGLQRPRVDGIVGRQVPVLLSALLAMGAIGLISGEANAAESFSGTYHADAAADGLRITVVVPHAAFSNTVMDGGGPSARAILDTAGRSEAFASFPYPGANIVGVPPIIAGASGGKLNPPAYPFWVGSSYPSVPKGESGGGPYLIKAESSDSASTATASAGLDAGGQAAVGLAKSETSTVAGVEAVTAQAMTDVTSFALGPLRLGRVFSTVKTVFGSDGVLTRQADTQVVGAMVGDTPVAITPKGLVVGGSAAPLDTAPARELLTRAKINVELMPRQDAASGVTAPAVRITQEDQSGQSGMQTTYLLGAASAFVDGVASGASKETPAGDMGSSPPGNDGSSPSPATPPGASAGSGDVAASPPTPSTAAHDVVRTSGIAGVPTAPVSFLVPSPEQPPTTAGAVTSATGVTPNVSGPASWPSVDTSGDRRGMAASAVTTTRAQLAARLLVNQSNATPMFVVMAAAAAVAIGLMRLLRIRKPRLR